MKLVSYIQYNLVVFFSSFWCSCRPVQTCKVFRLLLLFCACVLELRNRTMSSDYIYNIYIYISFFNLTLFIGFKRIEISSYNVLWKESLNSDDHQFHQYQHIEVTSDHNCNLCMPEKKPTTTNDVENPGALGQVQKCGGVRLLNRIPTLYTSFV